jgi:thiol-disulfide isomerase/thioredoxin
VDAGAKTAAAAAPPSPPSPPSPPPPPPPPPPACAEPDCLPGFRTTTIDGAALDTAALAGQVTLVMFWASYCEPCIADGPTLDGVYRRRRADGLAIVAFSRDTTDRETMRRFRDHYRLSYPIVLASDAEHAAFGAPETIPTFLLYGKDGRRRARFEGALGAGIFERELDLALAAR